MKYLEYPKYLEYLEYLELGQFRNFCDVLPYDGFPTLELVTILLLLQYYMPDLEPKIDLSQQIDNNIIFSLENITQN